MAVAPDRPQFRGAIHRWSVPIAVVLCIWLIAKAPGGAVRAGYTVYGVCIVAMLTVSGVYHLPQISRRVRWVLRRVDHSTILLAIAGSYTGVIVAAMNGATRNVMLVVAWVIAAVGIGLRVFWFHSPPVVVGLVYIGTGWMVLVNPGAYLSALGGGELALLVSGGLLYTVGAAVMATRWPNPWPAKFGYHEIFHTFVVAAAFVHWLTLFVLIDR